MTSGDKNDERLCPYCGYDLRGHAQPDARCPECGNIPSDYAQVPALARRRVIRSFLVSIAIFTALNGFLGFIDYQDSRFSLRHVFKSVLSIELGPFAGLALGKGVSAPAVLFGALIVSTCASAVRWPSQSWLVVLGHLAISVWFLSGVVQLVIWIGESV